MNNGNYVKSNQIAMDPGVFAEERMQAKGTYDFLIYVFSGLSAIPHVQIAQDFMRYIEQLAPHEIALNDRDLVLSYLNDDGKGVDVQNNTAVGYRLAKISKIFESIKKIPYDMLPDIDDAYPVDRPHRFTVDFIKANTKLPARQEKTDNFLQDLIIDLNYVTQTCDAIEFSLDTKINATAVTVYSKLSLNAYSNYISEIKSIIKEVKTTSKKAGKIIGKYFAKPNEKIANKSEINDYIQEQLRITRERIARAKSGEILNG